MKSNSRQRPTRRGRPGRWGRRRTRDRAEGHREDGSVQLFFEFVQEDVTVLEASTGFVGEACPECRSRVYRESGCLICYACGYSRCG